MSTSLPPRLPFESRVRGVSFHADAVARVIVGDAAVIVHEPDNPMDANACAVIVRDEIVGHLPAPVAARMVAGPDRAWTGEITEVSAGGDRPTGLMVRLLAPTHADAPALVPVRQPEPEAHPDEQAPTVYARSGRALGRLVQTTDTHCLVDTGTAVVPYPRDLVRTA